MGGRRALSLLFVLLLTPLTAPWAQSPAPPPPGISQAQMDAVVSAITRSVLEKLKEEAPSVTASPKPASAADAPDAFDILLEQTKSLVAAGPAVGRGLAHLVDLLDTSAQGGRGHASFFLLLTAAIAAALGSEMLLGRSLRSWSERLASRANPDRGPGSLGYVAALALLDALGVFAFWLVGRTTLAELFTTGTLQDRFAFGVLAALFLWRLYALLFRIILRPQLPAARLCEVDNDDARRAYRLVSGFVLLIAVLRLLGLSLIAADTPTVAVEAGRLMFAPILFLVFLGLVLGMRQPARQWFGGLGRVAPFARLVGEHWVPLALSFFLALALTQAYGAVSGRHGVSGAMLLTMNMVFGLLLFETFLQSIVRRFDSQLPGFTAASDREKLPDVIARCLRVAVLIVVVVVVSEHWVVDVLNIVDARAWDSLTRAARAAGLTLFTAFVSWELVKYFTEAYMQRISEKALQGPPGGASNASAATRLGTLMPLVRAVLAVLIGTVAVLVALSDIGVDITPMLAGLSVFGLAVSFGSQTLVKDIVSGIFFLADDAFRVGEQIDCGKATGIVEGFTLRSIRLRHASGQIYTIPFGELGQIANFSRDWAAVKFTLRFARDTDLDKLRSATKALGEELMDDSSFGGDILEPLKMQGIGEIADNALVVRFKVKARPGNPGRIQDEVVQRMLRTFPALGLQLA